MIADLTYDSRPMTLSPGAFDSRVTSAFLSHWRCHTNIQCRITNMISVSAMNDHAHDRSPDNERFHTRCTGRVEQSATVASTTIW